ncbi:hypothetical protein F5Y03DRAFT_342499 [Xylaria venustula]|nr:hypothetical protein F5Y03DRAFT_342499 [Xylaria venustula]
MSSSNRGRQDRAGRSHDSPYREDDRGGVYYGGFYGQDVYRTMGPGASSGSSRASSREITRSVGTRYETRTPSRSRSREIRDLRSGQPSSHSRLEPGSYPSTTPLSTMSRVTRGGLPPPTYGAPIRDSSAPPTGNPSRYEDPYRTAMDLTDPRHDRHGPPLSSPFSRLANTYHDRDTAAGADEAQYRGFLATGKSTKKQRDRSTERYAGEPPQTEQWHRDAARYSSRAADGYRETSDLRRQMAHDYPGYDRYSAFRGHEERRVELDRLRGHMDRKTRAHENSHR